MSGGGGQSAPTSSTVTQTTVPDWLQPQVESLLGGATQQIFNATPAGDGNYNIAGVKPYIGFGSNIYTNPDGSPALNNGQLQYANSNGQPISAAQGQWNAANSAVAGFSPMQQQVQGNVQNMQNPNQFNQAMGLTAQEAGNSFTNPNTSSAFMNPYLQNALAPQVAFLQEQQGQQQAANQAQGVQAGAFGGSRMGVQNAQQNQANQLAMSNLVGQGYNTAYNAGMNQYNTEQQNQLQAASQLGSLAGGASGNQQQIYNLQNVLGGQQQQQQQNVLNQAISNYSQAQQYPEEQFNEYSSLLHGYAIPGQATTQYQAAPSATSMVAGLGTAALGASKLLGNKKGGVIKSKSKGDGIDKLALYNATSKKKA